MNEFTKERLKEIRRVLARNLGNVDYILNYGATKQDTARTMSFLLDDVTDDYFLENCKMVEEDNYRLSEEGVANE